jgi:hypothetical protein
MLFDCSAKEIDDCIENFLVQFNKQVQSMTSSKFKSFVSIAFMLSS